MAIKNYDKTKAKNHRKELSDIRDTMKVVREEHLQVRGNRIDNAWNGEASEVFMGKMDKLEQHMQNTIMNITDLVNQLKDISDSIEKTEKENAKS